MFKFIEIIEILKSITKHLKIRASFNYRRRTIICLSLYYSYQRILDLLEPAQSCTSKFKLSCASTSV